VTSAGAHRQHRGGLGPWTGWAARGWRQSSPRRHLSVTGAR